MKKFLLTLVVVGMCISPVCAAPLEGIEHDIAVCSKIEDRVNTSYRVELHSSGEISSGNSPDMLTIILVDRAGIRLPCNRGGRAIARSISKGHGIRTSIRIDAG